MDKDKVLEIARDCGMHVAKGGNGFWDNPEMLMLFANAAEADYSKRVSVRFAEMLEALASDIRNMGKEG